MRGQAMTEFLAACAVLVPLFLGIVYVAKYVDVKGAAVQASRYVAFERALDPGAAHKPADVLAEEARARFFTDGARAGGALAFQDSTRALKPDQAYVALWRTVDGERLLRNYADVSVALREEPLGGRLTSMYNDAARFFRLNRRGLYYADVEVPLANVAHFEPLRAIDLKLAATTAVLGDAWNANGADDVRRRLQHSPAFVPSFFPPFPGFEPLFRFMTNTPGPQIGCVSPDVVPADRLERYVRPGYCRR